LAADDEKENVARGCLCGRGNRGQAFGRLASGDGTGKA
jgi:hypothetical protein